MQWQPPQKKFTACKSYCRLEWRSAGLAIAILLLAVHVSYGTTVYAYNYGFDASDATEALQAAIDSGADQVIISNLGIDWILRPVFLKSNQELIFESGVEVVAKEGEFQDPNDCLFSSRYESNIVLRGYGATLRMRKQDYMQETYADSEWRHVLSFTSCSNITVMGLTLCDSGGDGIFIGAGMNEPPCQEIVIQDVVCDNNYRLGIGINSVKGLTIENSILKNTKGTAPQSGLGMETDFSSSQLVDCTIKNCWFENNAKSSLLVNLRSSFSTTNDVSITFTGCTVTNETGWGIHIATFPVDSASGWIKFQDCLIDSVQAVGLYCQLKAAYGIDVTFERCTWRNIVDTNSQLGMDDYPMLLTNEIPYYVGEYGGLHFIDCQLDDQLDRCFLKTLETAASEGCANLKGNILVNNPYGVSMDLGPKAHDIDLTLSGETTIAADKSDDFPPKVYPMPASNQVFFKFQTIVSETVKINLYNIAGQRVLSLVEDIDPYHSLVFCDTSSLLSGVYFYIAQRTDRQDKGKLVIRK